MKPATLEWLLNSTNVMHIVQIDGKYYSLAIEQTRLYLVYFRCFQTYGLTNQLLSLPTIVADACKPHVSFLPIIEPLEYMISFLLLPTDSYFSRPECQLGTYTSGEALLKDIQNIVILDAL